MISLAIIVVAMAIALLNAINFYIKIKLPRLIFSSFERATVICIVLGLIGVFTARFGI
ncbi:MAG: hypothetical protein P1U65_08860 [Minwuia sp.]|nr:hypothetical protein [Minwuia sp.]